MLRVYENQSGKPEQAFYKQNQDYPKRIEVRSNFGNGIVFKARGMKMSKQDQVSLEVFSVETDEITGEKRYISKKELDQIISIVKKSKDQYTVLSTKPL